MSEEKDYSVPAIDRAVVILDALCDRNLTITDVNKDLGIAKTTAFVMLNTLKKYRLIELNEDGTYKLGPRTFQWGMNFYNNINLTNIARPFIENLVKDTPYTGHLAILPDGNNLPIYIDKIEGNGFVRFATSVGQQLPLHLSGVGKALGVNLNDEAILSAIDKHNKSNKENKFNILKKYKADIKFIKENGYVIENEEMEKGIRCLAVPIYGPNKEVLAAISITSLTSDLNEPSFIKWSKRAKQTALQISKEIGYNI